MTDSKLTALTEDTNPTIDDLVYVVNDPDGTPAEKKVTVENLLSLHTPGTFVDRGDPSVVDFDEGDLTTDGAWHDLDLSSIVPSGATAVALRVVLTDDAGQYIQFRKNGDSNDVAHPSVRTQVNAVAVIHQITVFCDSDQVIEYRTTSATWAQIDVTVYGWITNVSNSVLGYSDKLIDRGDPADWDFEETDLTTDASWYDLDCSSIVPAGATHIAFRGYINGSANDYFQIRKNGNSNAYTAQTMTCQRTGPIEFCWIVPCDASRIVEYAAANVSWTGIKIVITGWVIDSADNPLFIDTQIADDSASLNFTNLRSDEFDEWKLELINMVPASDAQLQLRMSTNGGSSYDSGANYGFMLHLFSTSYDVISGGDSGESEIMLSATLESTRDEGYCGSVKLFNLASSSKYKVVTMNGVEASNDGHMYGNMGGGSYQIDTTVDAFQLLMSTGNISSGIARLYGVRK